MVFCLKYVKIGFTPFCFSGLDVMRGTYHEAPLYANYLSPLLLSLP